MKNSRSIFLGLSTSFFTIFLIMGFIPDAFSDIDLNEIAGVHKTWGYERESLSSNKIAYYFGFHGNGGVGPDYTKVFEFIDNNGGTGHLGTWNSLDKKKDYEKYHTWGIGKNCGGDTCNWSDTVSDMKEVISELKKQKLDTSNAKLFLIGHSFGGGAVSMIASEIDDVDYDMVWIIDPVANGGFRKSVMYDCGESEQYILGCSTNSPKREFGSNIKNLIINYQTDDANPRDYNEKAFYPEKWKIESDQKTIKEYDHCPADVDTVEEHVEYITKEVEEKLHDAEYCITNYKWNLVKKAECLAKTVVKTVTEKKVTQVHTIKKGENCHTNIGKLTQGMESKDKGWEFVKQQMLKMNKKPTLNISNNVQIYNITQGQTIEIPVTVTDRNTDYDRNNLLKLRILDSHPNLQLSFQEEDRTNDQLRGNLTITGLNSTANPIKIAIQAEDNGFPCDDCTKKDNIARGAMGMWDRKEITIFVNSTSEISPVIRPPEILPDDNSIIIPKWIKEQTKWWVAGSISDEEFIQLIEYLMENKIIQISEFPEHNQPNDKPIPLWIKINANWWLNGQTSDLEFAKGLEYLVKLGIIRN